MLTKRACSGKNMLVGLLASTWVFLLLVGCYDGTMNNDPATLISPGTKEIPNRAYEGRSGIVGELVIPEGVATIGEEAFAGCSGLTSVKIPATVTSIKSGAFSKCSRLTSVQLSDGGITKIESRTFLDCGLTTVELPASVTRVANMAFQDCRDLTSVKMPGVTLIEAGAFAWCDSLTSVELSNGGTWYVTKDSKGAEDKTGGTLVSPTDAATVATKMRNEYKDHYWYKQ